MTLSTTHATQVFGSTNPNLNDRGCCSNYWRLCCSEELIASEIPAMHEFVNVIE